MSTAPAFATATPSSARDAFVDRRPRLHSREAQFEVPARWVHIGSAALLCWVAASCALKAPGAGAFGCGLAVALLLALRVTRARVWRLQMVALVCAPLALAHQAWPSVAWLVPYFAVATVLGAALSGGNLFALVAACVVAMVGAQMPVSVDTLGDVVMYAVFFCAFASLGRSVLFGAVAFAEHKERARADGEILQLHHDASLLRLLGSDDGDADRALISRTLAARDACYRALQLGRAALQADGAALYLREPGQQSFVLHEQVTTTDGAFVARVTLSGVCGIVDKSRRAVRLLDDAIVRQHRAGARAAVAAPLLEHGVVFAVVLFDVDRAQAFDARQEQLAIGFADDIGNALRTERVLSALDDERHKNARVFAAGRAFCGVVRLADALDQTLKVACDLCPHASIAVLTVERAAGSAPILCVARTSVGPEGRATALPLGEGERFAVDAEAWVGRALVQRAALPHTTVDVAARGLMMHNDRRTRALGDLRVLPLTAQGEVTGLLVVAVPHGERLRPHTKDALDVVCDIAGLALAGARLFFSVEHQATTDGLTGLINRRTLDAQFDVAILRSRRAQQPLAAILVDVDHFKQVNDTYGHATGDVVLVGVANALREVARQTDIVARYGGEEMCVVLEGTAAQGAVQLADRMRLAIKALTFDSAKGPVSVNASFGVAVLAAGEDALALRERADAALYRAKHAGRDRVMLDDSRA